MPKTKKKAASTSSSDSDSGPDDRTPAPAAKKAKKPEKPEKAQEQEEENSWLLGKNRYATLTEFKGTWFVDVREFYLAGDGEKKPSKKGIMLTMEQWKKLKESTDEIDEAIKKCVK